ncbi:hypothetical protein AB9E29_33875, partial [Rhizobium leguminosarum]
RNRQIIVTEALTTNVRIRTSTCTAFVAIDPKWETPHYWTIIKNASPPFTDYYLLASLDLERDATGAIGRVSAENAV